MKRFLIVVGLYCASALCPVHVAIADEFHDGGESNFEGILARQAAERRAIVTCDLINQSAFPSLRALQWLFGGPKLVKTFGPGPKYQVQNDCHNERNRRSKTDYYCYCG